MNGDATTHYFAPILLQGNAIDRLRTLDSESVDCCVTSPPYYGLRDYGTAEWLGGDPNCDHKGNPFATKANINANCGSGVDIKNAADTEPMKSVCTKCGAIRIDDQIGLEETPEEYISKLVEVFAEVRRVLRDAGTLRVNIADSYATGTTASRQQGNRGIGLATQSAQDAVGRIGSPAGCKTKDLIGIPWMLAFALRADGWYLRQEIIWAKNNPMPESVTDRCTKSHESIFLFAKSKSYYYDAKAIAEPTITSDDSDRDRDVSKLNNCPGRTRMAGLKTNNYETRNKRDVWTINSHPFSGAHFATFPVELPQTCLLAGSRIGGTVLDPFNGAGTTGIAAMNNGRNYIGIDLNEEYLEITRQRFVDVVQYSEPLFGI